MSARSDEMRWYARLIKLAHDLDSDEMRWYARLIKLAHDLEMDGRGQEAQDLREAARIVAEFVELE